MGVLTDLFLAPPEDITPELAASGPTNAYRALEGKGWYPEGVLRLLLAVGEARSADEMLAFNADNVVTDTANCCCIVPFPERLVTRLTSASPDELMRIRCAFEGTTEENLRADPFFGVIPSFWDQLMEFLAAAAAANDKKVYVWVSP